MISNQHPELAERSALLWTTTVLRHDLKAAHLAVWGVNLLKLPHRSSCWVLLVRGALFCIIRHNPSESPHEELSASATQRMRPYAIVHQHVECNVSVISVGTQAGWWTYSSIVLWVTEVSEVAGFGAYQVIWETTDVVCLGRCCPLVSNVACGILSSDLWMQQMSDRHHLKPWLRLWSVFKASWSWNLIDTNARTFCWHTLNTRALCHIQTFIIWVSRIIIIIVVLFVVHICDCHIS